MNDLFRYVILGIPFGCVFALLAIGIVLTYKTSGVFNLAFGAQAFVSAAVFYDTRFRHHWDILPAFVLAVVIVGPLLGFILDRALFRHLRTAPALARLVTSLGLLVAIPEIVKLWFGASPAYGPPSIWPWGGDQLPTYHFGDFALDGNQVATLVITAVAVLALTVLFRFTTIGLRMRAVVESPRMTELSGINADRVSTFSWMLSSFFAGLAGVLLAPLFSQVNAIYFTTLLVAAIAAAAFGRLSSIPLTFLGGILLGVAQGLLGGYLPLNSVLATGLRPSLPFVALFLLLLFWPGLRKRREAADPLVGIDPPPPGLAAAERSAVLTHLTRVLGVVAIVVFVVLALRVVDSFWLLLLTQALIFSIIFLSITVITGMGGQISLCQATFAAVGAFATAQLVQELNLPVLGAMVLGALLAGVVGGLLAIPALRLGGIYLALATFAFALMFENVLVPLDWVSGGQVPVKVPRPVIGPVDFASDKSFLVLCLVVLAVVSVLVIFVRRGTTGRYLDALRGSEVAATSIGISPARAKITAFALSAAIAGLGGGLLATQKGEANPTDFVYFYGLFFVVIVVALGSRTVEGAIQAGLGFVLFAELLKYPLGWLGLPVRYAPIVEYIGFGLGAFTYAKHPEGILEFQKRKSLEFVQRQIDRRRAPADSAGSDTGSAPVPDAAVPAPAEVGVEP